MKKLSPKDKAKELIEKFSYKCRECDYLGNSREFAITSVNEILNFMELEDKDSDSCHNANSKWMDYWLNVRKELINFTF